MQFSGVLKNFPHVDGVVALTTEPAAEWRRTARIEVLRRVMRGYLTHPNFAGFSSWLGCEDNQIVRLTGDVDLRPRSSVVSPPSRSSAARPYDPRRRRATAEMLPVADKSRRTTVSGERLVLGTNCGGSTRTRD